MARAGLRTVHKYSDVFKLAAVRLSHEPGILVKTVAAALVIHPLVLSKWRKEVRDAALRVPRQSSVLDTQHRIIRKRAKLYAWWHREHHYLVAARSDRFRRATLD